MTRRSGNTTLKLTQVRRKLRENERRTEKFLATFQILQRIDSWLQILLDCHAFAIDQHQAGIRTDYMEAYAALSSMAFANAESARLLLLRGSYGNCLANIRTLAAQNDLIQDLSLNPASPAKWLRLRSFKPDEDSQEAKSLRNYFRDSSVRRRLNHLGETPLSNSIYGIASEAVHGTPWASHLFSPESLGDPGMFFVQYSPQYHPIRALSYTILLQATLPHLSGFFLQSCDPQFRGKDRRFDLLSSRYFVHLDVYEIESPKINELLGRVEEAQDRVAAGEDFDSVFPPDLETASGRKVKKL